MRKPGAISALLFLFLAGCSSLQLDKARTAFYQGDFSAADRVLAACGDISKKDRLLCYMEKGTVLHYSASYEESTAALLSASGIMSGQDQISVSEQTSAMLVNDQVTDYKGEYSERLWVHSFLMMNFLLQYDYEAALVEAKQALEVYDSHPGSLVGDYFSRALVALCFENMGKPDDARIEYERLAKAMGGAPLSAVSIAPGKGELVLFVGQGRVPLKEAVDMVFPPSVRISIPKYTGSQSVSPLWIACDGEEVSALGISTDLGAVARASLNDRSAAYITRQGIRAGAKETIAQELGEHNELGEAVARIILFLLEEADTRSWQTLPGYLTLMRIELDAGVHDLEISSGGGASIHLNDVEISENRRVYRSVRF
jgi:hypothetical protein